MSFSVAGKQTDVAGKGLVIHDYKSLECCSFRRLHVVLSEKCTCLTMNLRFTAQARQQLRRRHDVVRCPTSTAKQPEVINQTSARKSRNSNRHIVNLSIISSKRSLQFSTTLSSHWFQFSQQHPGSRAAMISGLID